MNKYIKSLLVVASFALIGFSSKVSAQSVPYGVPTSGLDIYSTNEVMTNKVWIDGKFIFRKVVYLGNLPNANVATIAHGLSNVTFTSVAGLMRGSYQSSTYVMNLPFGYPWDANGYCVGLQASQTYVEVRTGNSAFTGYVGYAILEYTKN